MKLQTLKKEVFDLTYTQNTIQLKKERPDLTSGRDLRYKTHWFAILEQLRLLRSQGCDISLDDLAQSEKMLKESLFNIGRVAGLGDHQIETDWQRIKLEVEFSDIHIEEL